MLGALYREAGMGKARTNVTPDAALLAEARVFEMNVSAIAEGALEAAVKAERARRWYAENAEAIEQRRQRIEERALILADHAVWKP
jgi:post-segregation antitoxin (ccd killing protein)